jgi:hypothetical protein
MRKASNPNSNYNKFIIDTFLEAAHNKAFHHHWMTADTWVKLIVQYYKPPIDKLFTSSDLLNAIRQTKWLVDDIDTTKVIDDEVSLYRNNYRPKGGRSSTAFMLLLKEKSLEERVHQ